VTAAWVQERLGGDLAYTTVVTILTRLLAKDAVARERQERSFIWTPTADVAGLAALKMRWLLDNATARPSSPALSPRCRRATNRCCARCSKRRRALGADRVVAWDVLFDPASVAGTRRKASAQLTVWGLDEAVFTTELVVSELVTNAIRYGGPPVQLRLIHGRSLSCEVSDCSDTAPHLRRARIFDEGGRGLLLVAQLTQRWGPATHRPARPSGPNRTFP
jgi:hypothetical protein